MNIWWHARESQQKSSLVFKIPQEKQQHVLPMTDFVKEKKRSA
jgi:hypothetical protein